MLGKFDSIFQTNHTLIHTPCKLCVTKKLIIHGKRDAQQQQQRLQFERKRNIFTNFWPFEARSILLYDAKILMNTHNWGSCLQTLQFRFGKLYQFVCIQMCVFVCDCALRLNSLVCSERYKKATEIEHVLSSQFGAVVVVVFLSSNSQWECVILALQKQKQTKNRKKVKQNASVRTLELSNRAAIASVLC